jgi:hypothetical protein
LPTLAVLYQLFKLELLHFFWIGLFIDLLPGPIAVYQFFRLGFGWKSLLLVFHPVNAYVHTVLVVSGFKKGGEFSRKVHDAPFLAFSVKLTKNNTT